MDFCLQRSEDRYGSLGHPEYPGVVKGSTPKPYINPTVSSGVRSGGG